MNNHRDVSRAQSNPGAVLPLDLVFVFLLLSAETYAFMILVLGYKRTIRPLKRLPMPLPADPARWPAVDVFIPIYNEPLEVVRPTVLAALCLDWPAEKFAIYILDDGHRPEFRTFAEEAGCQFITRSGNKHAKAGNIYPTGGLAAVRLAGTNQSRAGPRHPHRSGSNDREHRGQVVASGTSLARLVPVCLR